MNTVVSSLLWLLRSFVKSEKTTHLDRPLQEVCVTAVKFERRVHSQGMEPLTEDAIKPLYGMCRLLCLEERVS